MALRYVSGSGRPRQVLICAARARSVGSSVWATPRHPAGRSTCWRTMVRAVAVSPAAPGPGPIEVSSVLPPPPQAARARPRTTTTDRQRERMTPAYGDPVKVHLLDGTYELFRHHFGVPAGDRDPADEVAGARGVLWSVLTLLEGGVTHLGVATDHVIESFRNDLWPGYKSSAGVPEAILNQFQLLEDAL